MCGMEINIKGEGPFAGADSLPSSCPVHACGTFRYGNLRAHTLIPSNCQIHTYLHTLFSFSFRPAVYFRSAGLDAIADLPPCHSFQNHHGLIRYWDMTRDGDEAKYGAVFDEAGMLARFGLVQRESED